MCPTCHSDPNGCERSPFASDHHNCMLGAFVGLGVSIVCPTFSAPHPRTRCGPSAWVFCCHLVRVWCAPPSQSPIPVPGVGPVLGSFVGVWRKHCVSYLLSTPIPGRRTDRWTDRQADKPTDQVSAAYLNRPTDRQMDRPTGTHTERPSVSCLLEQADRPADGQTDRQTNRQTKCWLPT